MKLDKNLVYSKKLFSSCTHSDREIDDNHGGPQCSGLVAMHVTVEGVPQILYVTIDGYLATKNGRKLLYGADGLPLRAVDVSSEIWDLSDYMSVQDESAVRWFNLKEVEKNRRPKLYRHSVFPNIIFQHVGVVHQPECSGLEPTRQRVLRPIENGDNEELYDICVPYDSPWFVQVDLEDLNP